MASTLTRIEVKICPNNEEEFRNSSKRLGCFVDDNGRSRYLCLPNSRKSKLLEFCYSQKIGPWRQAGYCPQILDADQLNGETCANFTYGCPNNTYDMQKLYQYPACLQIDTKGKCYLADPECAYTRRAYSNTSTGDVHPTTGNLGYHITIAILSFILFIALLTLACFVFRRSWTKRRKAKDDLGKENGVHNKPEEIPFIKDKQASDQCTKIDKETAIKTAINMLLCKDINEKLEEKDIDDLRDFTKDILSEEERKKPRKDFLRCLDKKVDLKKNLYYFQALLHRIGKHELVDECAKVAEALPVTIYLERPKRPPENGFKDISFHVNCKDKLTTRKIEDIRTQLMLMLKEPVIYRGGEKTKSYLLTYVIPESKISLLRREILKFSSELLALDIDFFLLDGWKHELKSKDTNSCSNVLELTLFPYPRESNIDEQDNTPVYQTGQPNVVRTATIHVPNMRIIAHISVAANNTLWISDDLDHFYHINMQGTVLYQEHVEDFGAITGHMVTKHGDLVYANKKNKAIYRISSSTLCSLFVETGLWEPTCIYSSQIKERILVGLTKGYEAKISWYDSTEDERREVKNIYGKNLFQLPSRIVESKEGDLYVIDAKTRVLLGLNENGHHKFTYRGQNPSSFYPSGVCINKYYHILVSDFRSNTICILNKHGMFLKFLDFILEKSALNYPRALCTDGKEHLFIGQFDQKSEGTKINIFKYLSDDA